MNLRQRYLWFKRLLEYGFNYYFLEKPRGIDFSKRSRDRKSDPSSSGYALTSKQALRYMLRDVPRDENSSFLDVGGGKGGTAVFARSIGFRRSASLEFEEYLHQIALRNILRLDLAGKVELLHDDALKFSRYSEYSHIFMFRPLNGEKLSELFDHIANTLITSPRLYAQYFFIIYGGIPLDQIIQSLFRPLEFNCLAVTLESDVICPFRGNNIRVVSVLFNE